MPLVSLMLLMSTLTSALAVLWKLKKLKISNVSKESHGLMWLRSTMKECHCWFSGHWKEHFEWCQTHLSFSISPAKTTDCSENVHTFLHRFMITYLPTLHLPYFVLSANQTSVKVIKRKAIILGLLKWLRLKHCNFCLGAWRRRLNIFH